MEIARREPAADWSTWSSPAAPTCPRQAEIFVPGGAALPRPHPALGRGDPDDRAGLRQLDRRRRLRARHVRLRRSWSSERAKVFLGGPPLVKMATGEDADDEALGGAEMHARVSGVADYLAVDEVDAIRHRAAASSPASTGASSARRRARRPAEPALRRRRAARHRVRRPASAVRPARGARPHRRRQPTFDEFKPLYGTSLVTGWAIAPRLPDRRPRERSRRALLRGGARRRRSSSSSPTRPTSRCVFLQNTTGYMVGHELRAGRHHQGRREDDQRRAELRRSRT